MGPRTTLHDPMAHAQWGAVGDQGSFDGFTSRWTIDDIPSTPIENLRFDLADPHSHTSLDAVIIL